jgi:hypothetical protein
MTQPFANPWISAALLVGIGFITCVAAKPGLARLPHAPRGMLWITVLVLSALPWFAPMEPLGARMLAAVGCGALLLPKLVDAYVAPGHWRRLDLVKWLAWLPYPFVLVHREPAPEAQALRPRVESLRLVLRGSAEVLAGSMLLHWAMGADLGAISFWLDHFVKLIAMYLIAFDGAWVLACGVLRLLGQRVIDFSRHPILASTPADFWRRYNREAGRFLHYNVFKPLGGLRAPRRIILVTLLLNGFAHEYLAWLLAGRLQGYQTMFFALHGVATMLTFDVRPRGAWRVVGIICTFAFGVVTSVLFFTSVNEFLPWYSRGSILR